MTTHIESFSVAKQSTLDALVKLEKMAKELDRSDSYLKCLAIEKFVANGDVTEVKEKPVNININNLADLMRSMSREQLENLPLEQYQSIKSGAEELAHRIGKISLARSVK